jgi:hypothetical protein
MFTHILVGPPAGSEWDEGFDTPQLDGWGGNWTEVSQAGTAYTDVENGLGKAHINGAGSQHIKMRWTTTIKGAFDISCYGQIDNLSPGTAINNWNGCFIDLHNADWSDRLYLGGEYWGGNNFHRIIRQNWSYNEIATARTSSQFWLRLTRDNSVNGYINIYYIDAPSGDWTEWAVFAPHNDIDNEDLYLEAGIFGSSGGTMVCDVSYDNWTITHEG